MTWPQLWFASILMFFFQCHFICFFSLSSTDLNHTLPKQTRPGWAQLLTFPPPSSSLAASTLQHSANCLFFVCVFFLLFFFFYIELFCWSVNITPPPLGPDRRPSGSPRGSATLSLAMPQVRDTFVDTFATAQFWSVCVHCPKICALNVTRKR